jgi:hypothetical protein
MNGESAASWRKTVLWNVALLSLSLVVLALLADRQRLFLANLVLAGLLAFNAAWFLVVLRLRTVGYLLIVLTGLDVFLVVLWFLRASSGR